MPEDDGGKLADQVRAICMALPGVTERPSHGAPAWFVRDRRSFAQLWADGHHDNRFPHLWCASTLEGQQALIAADPGRFFRPPYVGHRGWVGVRLDGGPDWTEIGELCQDAYRLIAVPRPPRLPGPPAATVRTVLTWAGPVAGAWRSARSCPGSR